MPDGYFVCFLCSIPYKRTIVQCFQTPTCPKRRRQWAKSCGMNFPQQAKICEHHFKETDIRRGRTGSFLVKTAVPIRIKGQKECSDYLQDDNSNAELETDPLAFTEEGTQLKTPMATEVRNVKFYNGTMSADVSSQTSETCAELVMAAQREYELAEQNKTLKRKVEEAEGFLKNVERFLSSGQIKKIKNSKMSEQWDIDNILEAVKIYEESGPAYMYLLHIGYPFPCRSSVSKWLPKVRNGEIL